MLSSVAVITATLVMTLTGYSAYDPGMRGDGITTSGLLAWEGSCACPPEYPFFTLFLVPALGRIFVCADRGSVIEGNRLDVYFKSRRAALAFGHKELLVEVRRWQTLRRTSVRSYSRE